MEEDWDLVNSLNSSLNIPENIEKSTSVELNFNRFANQPEFHIDDEGYPEDYDQQLMDEGVIFCDSPPPEEELYENEEEDFSQEIEYDDEELIQEEEELISEEEQLIPEEEQLIPEEEQLIPEEEQLIQEESLAQEEEELSQEKEEESIQYKEESIKYEEDPIQVEEDPIQVEEDSIQSEEDSIQYEEESIKGEEGDLIEKDKELKSKEESIHEQEEFVREDDELTQNEKNLIEEEFIRDEEELTQGEEEFDNDEDINFTLGDSKLIDNDAINDDVQNNNEIEQQRINQFKNIYLSPFFPINNFMNEQENNTRESQVDKNAIWKNTQAGPSVPYISPEVPKEENVREIPKFNPPFPPFSSASFSFGSSFKSTQPTKEVEEELSQKLGQLQSTLQKNENVSEERFSPSTRPTKQARSTHSIKKSPLITKSLPSFAASPKSIPPLSFQKLPITVDIPPTKLTEDEEQHEQDPAIIKENISNCFLFSSQHNNQLTGIYLYLQDRMSDVTKWYQLKHLDLSRQYLTSLNDLDVCFPMLETLIISHNELKSISGLPKSLCYLYASHNKLTEVDIYRLTQLQRLDLSHNVIINFENMSQLKSLRTLDASNNNIKSCQPFQNLTGLIVLSLKSNMIQKLTGFNYGHGRFQLESLDISYNRLECLDSVDSLQQLRELDATHNDIKCVQLDQPMIKLCKLKLSFNRLKSFDVSLFPDVRTLYLDDNQIERIIGVACISRLDSFSLRDQGRQKVEYNMQYLRGTRKLYLSGSPFKSMHQLKDFYSLETLELCSAGLEELPANFSKLVPNLVNLYLSMNRLQDIKSLKRLKYLKRLYLIDNRLISLNEVILTVRNLERLHVLDLRQNPMCSNIYSALDTSIIKFSSNQEKISPYITTAHDDSWELTDLEFKQNLSDHWKTRREVYRAFMIKECPKLNELDHLSITSRERNSGDKVIDSFHKSRTSSQKSY